MHPSNQCHTVGPLSMSGEALWCLRLTGSPSATVQFKIAGLRRGMVQRSLEPQNNLNCSALFLPLLFSTELCRLGLIKNMFAQGRR